MWSDLSFDVRSFDPESWGPSWGLTWEAAQDETLLLGGGGPDPSDTKGSTERESDVFDEPYKAYVKRVNEQRAAEWQESLSTKPLIDGRGIANTNDKDYSSNVGQVAPGKTIEEEAAEKAAFVILEAQKGIKTAKESLGELTKASKEAIAARHDEDAALAAFAFLVFEND